MTPAPAAPDPAPHLVDAEWLSKHLDDERVRIVDLRWYLRGKPGIEAYASGHVPGAVFVDLTDVTAETGPGRHPIPSPERLTAAMRRAGVRANSHVVVYDDAAGSIAARLWWLLRAHGHAAISVLDGGLPAWTAAGHPLSTEVPATTPGDFIAGPRAPWAVDKTEVKARIGRPGAVLLDARARERYRGDEEPIDARPGHVPGAKSAPFAGNVRDGRFLSPGELRARYAALGITDGREVVVYCGSGVTACHDLLAMELAGLGGARLYEGSWSDWSADPLLPAARGDEPGTL